DQVELLTSNKQHAKDDWLKFVITAKAKSKIKHALKEQRKKTAVSGRDVLEKKFYKNKLEFTIQNIADFANFLKLSSNQELFYRAALDVVGVAEVKDFANFKKHPEKYVEKKLEKQHTIEELVSTKRGK